MMLVTNGLPQSQVIDGDAEVSGHHMPTNTMPKQKSLNTTPAQTSPKQPGPGTKAEFCKLFQQGKCKGRECPRDASHKHSCEICGSPQHGSSGCNTFDKKDGAGKGKPKRRGGGGKPKPYGGGKANWGKWGKH